MWPNIILNWKYFLLTHFSSFILFFLVHCKISLIEMEMSLLTAFLCAFSLTQWTGQNLFPLSSPLPSINFWASPALTWSTATSDNHFPSLVLLLSLSNDILQTAVKLQCRSVHTPHGSMPDVQASVICPLPSVPATLLPTVHHAFLQQCYCTLQNMLCPHLCIKLHRIPKPKAVCSHDFVLRASYLPLKL